MLLEVELRQVTLRFKKSSRSGSHTNCVEVAHTLSHLRDSKNPQGPVLTGDVRALLRSLR
ncbi:DUF397 domain-containing protein [Actinokineospora diospyrosa]|uniref:DUF397 domain-containing protein n=1 Tax=Actinokineospora diospyrosa TaxID=103728 RepID=A0ABT1I593_9PSEU|nr:DUF397 domain-containing protein [Actinokineospora diospyrosa]MCP2267739.1 protein of unknown function (DUF397) [Actinokineospora diospyrosa]